MAVAVQAGGVRLAGLVSVAVAGQAVFAALFRIGGAQIAAFLPFDLIRGQGFSAAMAGAAMIMGSSRDWQNERCDEASPIVRRH